MTEIEEKQWIVSRLDVLHKTAFDELQMSKEAFAKERLEEIAVLTGRRNNFISGVVIFVTILIGLYETQWIDRGYFLALIIGDIIAGIFVFTIMNRLIRIVASAYVPIENSLVHAQEKLNHNYGFVIQRTKTLSSISVETWNNYFDFMGLLTAIVLIPMYMTLNERRKLNFLNSEIKKSFATASEQLEGGIISSIPLFDGLDTALFPTLLLQYVTEAISTYRDYKTKNPVSSNPET